MMRLAIALIAVCLMAEAAHSATPFPSPVIGPVPMLRSVAQLRQMTFPLPPRPVTGGGAPPDSLEGSIGGSSSTGGKSSSGSLGNLGAIGSQETAAVQAGATRGSSSSGSQGSVGAIGSQETAAVQAGVTGGSSSSGSQGNVGAIGSQETAAVQAGVTGGSSSSGSQGSVGQSGSQGNLGSGSQASASQGSSSSSTSQAASPYAAGNGIVLRPMQMLDAITKSFVYTASANVDTQLVSSLKSGDPNTKVDIFVEQANPTWPFVSGRFSTLPYGVHTYLFTLSLQGQYREDSVNLEIGNTTFSKGQMVVSPAGDMQVLFSYDASVNAGNLFFRAWKVGSRTGLAWSFYRVQLVQLN